MTYAIVETFGKQILVEKGHFYNFDKLSLEKGKIFYLRKILFVNYSNGTHVGRPFLDNLFCVEVKVLHHFLGKKTQIYKMKPKKKTRKKMGSKKNLTRVLINFIYKKTILNTYSKTINYNFTYGYVFIVVGKKLVLVRRTFKSSGGKLSKPIYNCSNFAAQCDPPECEFDPPEYRSASLIRWSASVIKSCF